ncbi:SDR family oxidoreductase [Streptomyces sp. NPDC057950]|uniref:SDR family oxidoreductase n=1 Tax=Streptomyces sp. NPDC057950 TaxID=3346288 RepID=UPI0036DFD038
MHSNGDIVRNNGRALPAAPAGPRRLTGDVTRPRLGLDGEELRAAAAADRIVHCAALTDFGLPDGSGPGEPAPSTSLRLTGAHAVDGSGPRVRARGPRGAGAGERAQDARESQPGSGP